MDRRLRLVLIIGLTGSVAVARAAESCPPGEAPVQGSWLGYTKPGEATLRALAWLDGDRLRRFDGSGLSSGLPVHGVLTGARARIERVEAYTSRLGEDHCVYAATLASSPPATWEVWAGNDTLANAIRPPTDSELARFEGREHACVVQGDPPEGNAECVRPKLLAVSDLDHDGRLEHWSTAPLTWDTGVHVAEAQADGFEPLVSACAGCSD